MYYKLEGVKELQGSGGRVPDKGSKLLEREIDCTKDRWGALCLVYSKKKKGLGVLGFKNHEQGDGVYGTRNPRKSRRIAGSIIDHPY